MEPQIRLSERRACRLLELDRSSYRYEAVADRDAELRGKLGELARQKPRYGFRRLHVLRERDVVPQTYKLHSFFRITAFKASRSRLRSATRYLSRQFSSSNSFNRSASLTRLLLPMCYVDKAFGTRFYAVLQSATISFSGCNSRNR